MHIKYHPAQPQELDAIMNIENAGFTPAEAATRDSMAVRIRLYHDTFIVAHADNGQVIGYLVGPSFDQRYLTDALYSQGRSNQDDDPYQTVLSLAVHPNFRGQHVGSGLLDQLVAVAQRQGRHAITLTCLARLVPFYVRNGFVNEGVSASSHASETWYNMVYSLD